jgi:hypothetical protein
MSNLGLPLLRKRINIWFQFTSCHVTAHQWFLNRTCICFVAYIKKTVHTHTHTYIYVLSNTLAKCCKIAVSYLKGVCDCLWQLKILLIILHVPPSLGMRIHFFSSTTEFQYPMLTLIFKVSARTHASLTLFWNLSQWWSRKIATWIEWTAVWLNFP